MATVFGLDFGTTNSLASLVIGDRAVALVDQVTRMPHPSVIWYRAGDVIVGRKARDNMDLTEAGAPPGFVRSPKMSLRREGPIYLDGQRIDPTDAVAEVLKHIKSDAALSRESASGHDLTSAVMTIPVDFRGAERRALRQAARKAGIGVVQFVHEPVAALYAYIRSRPDVARELGRLEGRSVLVFDWGGGTLDLTLCRIQAGSIMQIANLGDNEIGGDRFDERLRNLLRAKHAAAHSIEDVSALEQPGMSAKLLHQCEVVKINLSAPSADSEDVIIRNFIKADGAARNLVATITRGELERESASIVARGMARIDEILEQGRLNYQDIELCLATGGMVNMPAIRNGLTERFLGRVPRLENGDRIIAEGAAWIAHDGLRLTLAKPIEVLVADTSGSGTYYPLVEAGWQLPLENETQHVTNTRLFCTDPREGVAAVELAKPVKVGHSTPAEARKALCVATVKVDPKAQPLVERIECHLKIDHDYIASVTLRSTGRGHETETEFYDLEFGLALPNAERSPSAGDRLEPPPYASSGAKIASVPGSNLHQRPNVAPSPDVERDVESLWKLVPGDLVAKWKPQYFASGRPDATSRQKEERWFYVPCSICRRMISQIVAEGPVVLCGPQCGFA